MPFMAQQGSICSELRNYGDNRVAVRHHKASLDYSELNQRVDQLAAHLVDLNVVAGGAVAVCLDRSFEWIIATLAVMRAGAAYIPMDTTWPDERLCYVARDSGATHLIARQSMQARLNIGLIGIDPASDAEQIAARTPFTGANVAPEDLAYIIYTSGTSGYPKGVEITHANLAHLIRWHHKAFSITETDRASHLAGVSFDAAGWEIWPYLAAGASVSIVDDGIRSNPEQLQHWLLENEITVSYVPTALTTAMFDMHWPASTSLRFLLTGGDTLHRHPSAHLPFVVVNNYGPTECTVVATSGVVEPGSGTAPTIGLPIDGASIHLRNEDGTPTPEGSIGEICIGGAGVGRGYRNLRELTEANFIFDPYSYEPQARLYRSGDLGRQLPDGHIEFHGRRDSQEKIRGQRIELDEISHVLYRHPKVKFAIVKALPAESEDKHLVAYIVPAEGNEPTSTELQEFLARILPCYMVPTAFVRLPAVPLSANGKIDRKSLEAPGPSNLLPAIASTEPKSAVAETVLQIVRELLKSDGIDAQDDFFLVGGHSLLGSQLIMLVRESFEVDLTLRHLFEARTVERLALKVEDLLIAQVAAMTEEEVQREVDASV
jgi:amino acid adenylation domain-containing protein